MPEHLKNADLTKKETKDEIKSVISTFDKEWVLWGKRREEYLDGNHNGAGSTPLEGSWNARSRSEAIDEPDEEYKETQSDLTNSMEGFTSEQRAALVMIEINEDNF